WASPSRRRSWLGRRLLESGSFPAQGFNFNGRHGLLQLTSSLSFHALPPGAVVQRERCLHRIELIVSADPLPGSFAIHTENGPKGQTVTAHPLLRKTARQAFAACAHFSPRIVVSNRSPRSPGLRRIEDTELTGTFVKTG